MPRLRQWFHRRLKAFTAWALLKLAVAQIDEADGVKFGKDLREKTMLKLGYAPGMAVLTATRGWLAEVQQGLAD